MMPKSKKCPPWEYKDVLEHEKVLYAKTIYILDKLSDPSFNHKDNIQDSRKIHEHLFDELVPKNYEYYAGHYRGESFTCLINGEGFIPGEPSIGSPPHKVLNEMRTLSYFIENSWESIIDKAAAFEDKQKKILFLIEYACNLFVKFIWIHPYLNGNGHIARFIVNSFLILNKLRPISFTIEPRPDDFPYIKYTRLFHAGEKKPLMKEILKKLIET